LINPPWIVAVAGGSGSGKTTLARSILRAAGEHECVILAQDSYYFDQSQNFDHDGGSVNFDHPNAIDFDLLAANLADLKSGVSVSTPIYDFKTHSRSQTITTVTPRPLILVDGILMLSQAKLLPLFDESIFIQVDEATRFSRRMARDVRERGRTPEGVKEQFLNQVKPMHDQYVEPSRAHSSLLVVNQNITVQKTDQSPFQSQLIQIIEQALDRR
jgi:uridine kinase